VDWVHSLLREGKLYGMIGLIGGIVWSAGYAARVDDKWHKSEWMAPAEHDPGAMVAELDSRYFDGITE
jgi:hypothetical protein